MIIAEIGWNFLGDLDLAKKMIDQAKIAGCHFVKISIVGSKNLKRGPWDTDGRREIYNKSYLDKEKYDDLFKYSKSKDLQCFASIFNEESFNILLETSNKLIKIPSLEAYDLDLIKKSLDNFENVLVSTGALKSDELRNLKKFNDCKKFNCSTLCKLLSLKI